MVWMGVGLLFEVCWASVSGTQPAMVLVRMSSLSSMERMVIVMSSCMLGEGFATHE